MGVSVHVCSASAYLARNGICDREDGAERERECETTLSHWAYQRISSLDSPNASTRRIHTLCVNVRAGEWGASVPSLLPAAKSRQPTYCRWPARLGGPGTWRPSSPCCRCRPAPKRPVPPKASPPPRARGSPSPLSLEGGGRRGAVGGCACVLLNRWGIITDASKNASKIYLMKRSYKQAYRLTGTRKCALATDGMLVVTLQGGGGVFGRCATGRT